MPSLSATFSGRTRNLDARPDRLDLRDRKYQPELKNLAPQYPSQKVIDFYFPHYKNLVINQGQEGSCTGFGLSAVINYLRFSQWIVTNSKESEDNNQPDHFPVPPTIESVSPAMLYRLAKLYDEWPGEDYDGSSCRGAMKGWHKHGVCLWQHWPYHSNKNIKPSETWKQSAAENPIGSYYRVEKDSITDVQAAIQEVGAVYVSADVHNGWNVRRTDNPFPVIKYTPGQTPTGGHAFALVGYNSQGFIVQNSWGNTWGYNGFAVLTYPDWAEYARDAWVAVLGAPMEGALSSGSFTDTSLRDQPHISSPKSVGKAGSSKGVHPLPDNEQAYLRSIVLGNNGSPINRLLHTSTAKEAVEEACLHRPLAWLEKNKKAKNVVVYMHGGLNSERASIKRVRRLAPWFEANDICPIFVTWRTGALESIGQMMEDEVKKMLPFLSRDQGLREWWNRKKKERREAADRRIENICRKFLVRGIWSEMKENAALATNSGGGTSLLASHLAKLQKQTGVKIHLMGHSAGSIVGGHLLGELKKRKIKASSCHLYAPACTLAFANSHYIKATNNGTLPKKQLHIDIMNDERELSDHVGKVLGRPLYGKSLIYLISRALELTHKTAILGFEAAWNPDIGITNDVIHSSQHNEIKRWQNFAGAKTGHKIGSLTLHTKRRAQVDNGPGKIPLAHGSFDNDIKVVSTTFKRILGKNKLPVPIKDLSGF